MKLSRKLAKIILQICGALVRLPLGLNWLLAVVEPLTVLGAAFTIGYTIYWVVFSADQKHAYLAVTIKQLSDNWKAGLVLLIVLFYRTGSGSVSILTPPDLSAKLAILGSWQPNALAIRSN